MRTRSLSLAALIALAVIALPALAAPKGTLPPGELEAKRRLNETSRHGELVDVAYGEGRAPIRTWVMYPERKTKAPVVIVIHEIFGLSDWIRGVADELAAAGFVAVAPDLISGLGPNGGGTESVPDRDGVVQLVRGLSADETHARIAAVRDWALKLPASNGRFGTVGYCWGGARSFEQAATSPAPGACVVYYGTTPDSATLLRVSAPVQGHYGGDDARVNATIPAAKAALGAKKGAYEAFVYDGAGHGFLRQQDGRDGANRKATEAAWPRTIAFLKKRLE